MHGMTKMICVHGDINQILVRMRNATILVVRLRGVATEAIKNMVLAGIGKLMIVDDEVVTEEDLGAGFFFRDEDVGKNVSFDEWGNRGDFLRLITVPET